MIWRNKLIVSSCVLSSVISYLVTTQNSNSSLSLHCEASTLFLARSKKKKKKSRIRGHKILYFHFQSIGVGFFSLPPWVFFGAPPPWLMSFAAVLLIRSYHIFHLFIWKANVYCSAEQPHYCKYLLRQIKWFHVVALQSLISVCGIVFIITQFQRDKIAHLHW